MAQLGIADALRMGIMEEMRRDETVFCLGEDVDIKGGMGGAFTVTRGLTEEFGPERVINTPISEILIAGAASGCSDDGHAPCGGPAVRRFSVLHDGPTGEPGRQNVLYVRRSSESTYGDARSLRGDKPRRTARAKFRGIFHTCAGAEGDLPSTPYDAKGMIKQAIRDDNPVVVFEHKLLYGGSRKEKDALQTSGEVPETDYTVRIRKSGCPPGRYGSDHRSQPADELPGAGSGGSGCGKRRHQL